MKTQQLELVLAVYPNARGFAFVLVERDDFIVDWGISELSSGQRNEACLKKLGRLLDRYRPDAVVLRSDTAKGAATLLRSIAALAQERGVCVAAASRQQIRAAFSHLESPSRYAIAQAIAESHPALAALMPSPRKIWNGEDRRMGLFDAAALGLTFFRLREGEPDHISLN